MAPEKSFANLVHEEMGWPRVVIVQDSAHGLYLFRYTADGEFAGDTWHQTLEEARHQAEFEYTVALVDFRTSP